MRIGNLRHPVVVQRQVTSPVDATGHFPNSWSTLVARRASLEPLNGREYFQASGEHSDVTTRIRLRYDAGTAAITAYDRVVDQNVSPQVVYDILSIINPREGNRELVLMCRRA